MMLQFLSFSSLSLLQCGEIALYQFFLFAHVFFVANDRQVTVFEPSTSGSLSVGLDPAGAIAFVFCFFFAI